MPDLAAVDAFINAEIARLQIPGLGAAVIRHGEPVLLKGYGLADVEHGVPATEQTVFEIASLTKLFTATAIMMLVEAGQLSLETPIHDVLADLPEAWRGVTIQHLLSHTSGIKNYTDLKAYWDGTRQEHPFQHMVDLVREQPLVFEPGSNWAYSNTGYYLLGFAIEKLSGQSYAGFLQERIFGPLGMTQTRANDPAEIVPHRAAGYTLQNGRWYNKEYYSPSGTYAAGILLSSAADLAKWDAALYTDTLLPKAVLEAMWSPTHIPSPAETEFGFHMGLGWFSLDHKRHRFAGHNGGIRGFSSTMSRFVDDGLTVTLLWNLDMFDRPDHFANAVADFWLEPAANHK